MVDCLDIIIYELARYSDILVFDFRLLWSFLEGRVTEGLYI